MYVDMHCDTIYVLLDRELKRKADPSLAPSVLRRSDLMIDLEKLSKGGCFLQTFAAFVEMKEYPDATGRALRTIDLFQREMALNSDLIEPVRSWADIERLRQQGKMAALLSIEEGEATQGDPALLRIFYSLGVRMMTLTWNHENQLAFPNTLGKKAPLSEPQYGLKEKGFAIIEEMEKLGMLIDVSHLSDAGFWDIYHHTTRPFIASHSNARHLTGHVRNLTDEMIRALGERGGVTGLNFCSAFIRSSDAPEAFASTERICDHIQYLMKVGGEDVVGLGSDFDGIDVPPEFQNAAGLPLLAEALKKRGLTENQIEKVFSGNVLRVMKEILS